MNSIEEALSKDNSGFEACIYNYRCPCYRVHSYQAAEGEGRVRRTCPERAVSSGCCSRCGLGAPERLDAALAIFFLPVPQLRAARSHSHRALLESIEQDWLAPANRALHHVGSAFEIRDPFSGFTRTVCAGETMIGVLGHICDRVRSGKEDRFN